MRGKEQLQTPRLGLVIPRCHLSAKYRRSLLWYKHMKDMANPLCGYRHRVVCTAGVHLNPAAALPTALQKQTPPVLGAETEEFQICLKKLV